MKTSKLTEDDLPLLIQQKREHALLTELQLKRDGMIYDPTLKCICHRDIAARDSAREHERKQRAKRFAERGAK